MAGWQWPEIANRLQEVSDEVTALRQHPAQPAAVRRVHDEGDEADGAAL